MAAGAHIDLSSILTSVHIGAHADAPSHYHIEGQDISERPLRRYLGKVQVIRVQGIQAGERVTPQLLKGAIEAPRVLFDTGSFPDPERWNSDFCSLSPELIEELADQGVILVGIDTPSVDPEDSKALESHQALWRRDVSVLEGLVLKDIPEGIFTLVALPLPIERGDASPVRAVLLPYIPAMDDL